MQSLGWQLWGKASRSRDEHNSYPCFPLLRTWRVKSPFNMCLKNLCFAFKGLSWSFHYLKYECIRLPIETTTRFRNIKSYYFIGNTCHNYLSFCYFTFIYLSVYTHVCKCILCGVNRGQLMGVSSFLHHGKSGGQTQVCRHLLLPTEPSHWPTKSSLFKRAIAGIAMLIYSCFVLWWFTQRYLSDPMQPLMVLCIIDNFYK